MSHPLRAPNDAFGAFVPSAPVHATGAATGPLKGLGFAAKDLFDVAGLVTGCGNPDWAASHPPARAHAFAVQRLLDAGATLVGRTITDEISLGLLGRNQFHGTPINPRAPERLPGGSSSGSAAAVAGGLADLALGTDSGGSVRVPSSFCGLYGMRPTHGRISVAGLMTQSPSFDTVGVFARDAALLDTAYGLLLDDQAQAGKVETILVATDAFAIADAPVREALQPALAKLRALLPAEDITLSQEGLPRWAERQRRLQQAEFAVTFRDWIDAFNPRFSFEVGRGLALAALTAEMDLSAERAFRIAVRAEITDRLGGRALICLPTTPILPPLRGIPLSAMGEAGRRITELTGIAGLTGLPQISLPLGEAAGIPVGLSLIGWPGSDEVLLALAKTLAAA
ncbi:amidase [Acidisoma silvae]|uniref:Amidase n=1 Tax=Acidisoma silvae TaxID=2802396 RepID=A0A963YUS7_9PROT|nr:amidase [Acidisoma silvae]MCB8876800.1 amidase [Acidisoma silvae]